ncbi:hypothetical protein Tco_1192067 [Tanacetum coccineum]
MNHIFKLNRAGSLYPKTYWELLPKETLGATTQKDTVSYYPKRYWELLPKEILGAITQRETGMSYGKMEATNRLLAGMRASPSPSLCRLQGFSLDRVFPAQSVMIFVTTYVLDLPCLAVSRYQKCLRARQPVVLEVNIFPVGIHLRPTVLKSLPVGFHLRHDLGVIVFSWTTEVFLSNDRCLLGSRLSDSLQNLLLYGCMYFLLSFVLGTSHVVIMNQRHFAMLDEIGATPWMRFCISQYLYH